MQNNMRTIHVGIFQFFQKTKKTHKKHAGYKNPDTAASHPSLLEDAISINKIDISNVSVGLIY